MSEAISYIFTWHALSDACPKCQRLNGREYRDQDIFQNTLRDPFEGDIWDLNADHSLAHGTKHYGSALHCRCHIELHVIVDVDKIDSYHELTSLAELKKWF